MSTNKKEAVLSSAILFAAWLAIIVASAATQSASEALPIAYLAE